MRYKATIVLVALCLTLFLMQTIFGDDMTDLLVLNSSLASERPWTIITSMFAHVDPNHLMYNMLALVLFGIILESIVDTDKFVIIYFTAGLAAGITSILFYPVTLGASGAIFGVLGTLAVLRPRMPVYVSFVPMPMIFAALAWAAGDMIGLFVPSQIASAAHLTGLAIGLLAGVILRKGYGESMGRAAKYKMSEKEFHDWEEHYMKY